MRGMVTLDNNPKVSRKPFHKKFLTIITFKPATLMNRPAIMAIIIGEEKNLFISQQ
jgi:hypothetical protein